MTTLNAIRTLTIQYQSLGADAAKRELDGMIAAQRQAATAGGSAEKSVLSLARNIDALERRLVPAAKAQFDFNRATNQIDAALRQGTLSAERATAMIAALNAQMINGAAGQVQAAKATALNAGQLQNLGFQLNDILSGLAMGQSPFMIMAQQGGQVYQVLSSSPQGVGGALKELGSRFVGLVGPVGLAGAAISAAAVTGFAAWSSFTSKVQEAQIALNGVGRASGMTVDGLLGASTRAAGRSGISTAQGVTLGAGFAGAGIGGSMLEDLVASTRGFSRAFGLDLQEAGKELASAFADPAKGAEELNRRFGFLSADLQNTIQRQQAAGNIEAARNTLQEAYNRALAETTTRSNVLSSAFEAIKNSATGAWARFGADINRAIDPTTQEQIDAQLSRLDRRGVMTRDRGRRNELILDNVEVLREQQMQEAVTAMVRAMDKAANDLSIQATGVARGLLPGESRSGLIDQRDLLQRAIGDPEVLRRMGVSADQAREALARLNTAIDNFSTPLQRMIEDGALAVASASAVTAQQRAAVDAERAKVETIRSTNNEMMAGVAAANAYRLAIADSSRTLQDAVRSANDRLELSRLNPFQRAQREADFRARDLERATSVTAPAGVGGVEQAATRLANGFNSIFAERLGQLQAQFPQLQMTRGVSTFEEQRTLRAIYGNRAAVPGTSRHEVGLAADFSGRNLSSDQRASVIAAAERLGLTVLPSNHGALHVEGPRSWATQGARVPAAAAGVGNEARQVRALEGAAITQEMYGNVIREANTEVERQQRLLQAQIATFGMSTGQIVAATKAEEMRLNFEKQGVPLNEERIRQIDQIAQAYGRVAQASEDARISQQRSVQVLDSLREFGTSAFSGVATAIMQGKSASEAFNQALQRLASRMFDILGNQLMTALLGPMGGGGGGAFGGLLGGLFRSGPVGAPMVLPSAFDVGGVVGAGGRAGPMMPLGMWAGAPQYAMGGGVGPGARPIIAHDGEIILNAAQQRNAANAMRASAPANNNRGGNVSISVVNNSDARVEPRTSEDSDGNRLVEFVISRVDQEFARGRFDAAQRTRYGRAPRGVAR